MKKFLPFLFLFAGVAAVFGVLFLLMRTDTLPVNVRLLDRRKTVDRTPTGSVEEEVV